MSENPRRAAIAARLAEHVMHTLGCAAVTPSMEAWQRYELPLTYRFGWAPPMMLDGDPLFLLVSFCPELIAAVTAHLDEEALGWYLTLVEQFIEGWVEAPTEDPDEVYLRCQNDCDPGALRLKDQAELHALDNGIAVRGTPAAP